MERVHVDFFEYKGKHVLLMVDAFSKKIWTALMNTDTTKAKHWLFCMVGSVLR